MELKLTQLHSYKEHVHHAITKPRGSVLSISSLSESVPLLSVSKCCATETF